MDNQLKKGDVLLLPIKEIRQENKKSFFIVSHKGREHAIMMFEFQKNDPRTDRLQCVVKEISDGQPVFVQDFSLLYPRFYTEGQTYQFLVRRDMTHMAGGYYEVSDWHGFAFRLIYYGNNTLYQGQRIQCRVKSLVGNKLALELVNDKKTDTVEEVFDLNGLIERMDVSRLMGRWLRSAFMNNKVIREAHRSFQGDEEQWLLHVIRLLDDSIDSWVKPGCRRNSILLETFRQACLYMLEGSDFLMDYNDKERKDCQRMLSKAAWNAESYIKAIRLIEEDRHIAYIDEQLAKMKKSGYLFKPDKRLRELMCIFTLEKGLMEQKMQLIFDIILKGNKDNWYNEPFRSAFIDMLDLYITGTRRRMDALPDIEDTEGRELLHRIIRALAIQLLLSTGNDEVDRQLNRSMLYRYLTYVEGSKQDVLLEKSFRCLSETSMDGLGFGWEEVHDLTLMAIRLSSTLDEDRPMAAGIMQTWQGQKVQLQLTDKGMLLSPVERQPSLVAQIPDSMGLWDKCQIAVDGNLPSQLLYNKDKLHDYVGWWKSLEFNLFNATAPVKKTTSHKFKPDVRDRVYIRITGQDTENPDCFRCVVEDDHYEGEGRINMKHFVRYNPRIDMRAFVSHEGKPYLLKATVMSVGKDGLLHFTMEDLINECIHQMLNIGDISQCVVLEEYRNTYLCISEYGYSVQVPITKDMPKITRGSYIEVSVTDIRKGAVVEGEFLRQILNNFTVMDAFANLIDNYADDLVYEEVDEKVEEQQEVQLDEDYVFELLHIIDRKAVLDQDYIRTFNYLNVARFIALMLGRTELVQYYQGRMELLQIFEQFAINGSVNNTALFEQGRVNRDIIRNYPILQTRLLELEAISCMDEPARNAYLWEVLNKTTNVRLTSIIRLVLSYNMLSGFGLHDQREALRTKLNEILNIGLKTERPKYFGRENLHTEFKTSLVYPADNGMKPDLKAQTTEVMKMVCGFLNAEGGTLYIGVNNEGVASGIADDMPQFNDSMDKYDLYVRNNIVSQMGVNANSYVKSDWMETAGKTVYSLVIQPSPHPVKLDGQYYIRQGSSTWPVLGRDLDCFLERKELERQKLGIQPLDVAETVAEVQPEPVVAETVAVKDKPAVNDKFNYRDDAQILTSRIRSNPLYDWEDGYGEETACYFHLLEKNEYMITEQQSWDKTLLTLAVTNKEADGYIVIVYRSGRTLKVPVSELLDKTFFAKYKRNRDEEIYFACPATDKDALLTVFKNANGNNCYRVDDVANLEKGGMSDKGEVVTSVWFSDIVECDIIPAKYVSELRKIHNLRSTNLGNMINPEWAPNDWKCLNKLGLLVEE